jgi:hypothetical protein
VCGHREVYEVECLLKRWPERLLLLNEDNGGSSCSVMVAGCLEQSHAGRVLCVLSSVPYSALKQVLQ